MRETVLMILKRALWSLPPIIFGFYCLKSAFSSGNIPVAFAWLLTAAAMLIVVAIQMAFPIAEMIGDWFSRFYMPAANEIPPVSYILADRYELEKRWEQSMTEFQKIIEYHPDELPAHLGRLRIATHGFGDAHIAKKFLRGSLRKFRDPESQRTLRMEWEKLTSEIIEKSP